jgi:hypothetical protein
MLHGAMVGRGAQIKSDQQEATVPAAAEMVVFHCNGQQAKSEIRKIFRLMSAKGDNVDCCEKTMAVVCNDREGAEEANSHFQWLFLPLFVVLLLGTQLGS